MSSNREKPKKPNPGDFRYAVEGARIPWHAVGERYNPSDALAVVKFLFPPSGENDAAYGEALGEIGRGLEGLFAAGRSASKLTLGREVEKAEELVREQLGVKYASFTCNWTAGMETAYKLGGVGPGDEVIVPALTFIATVAYPLMIGAKVVFADIDPDTLGLDPEDVARKITRRTKMIVPVHVGGYACDMDPIMQLAGEHDIFVQEDAAHALGATYKGRQLGTIGHFGGYSFHEVKNINSFGEGGLLVSNHELGKQFGKARFLGLDFTRQIPDWLYDVTALDDRFGRPQIASNSSATELQALGFRLQFERLPEIIASRRRNAEFLCASFAAEPAIILPPQDTAETASSHHLFPLRIDAGALNGDIQSVKFKLKKKGVTEIAHFGPLYKFEILRQLGYEQKSIAATCPRTEEMFRHGYTHLPLYPLDDEQVAYMAETVLETVRALKR